MESHSHEYNAWATLTYKEAPPELIPKDLQYFVRRLRVIYPVPFRYYGVGEYGTRGLRPHFHIALFGVSFLDSEYIQKAWQKDGKPIGFVDVGELNKDSAAYIAGYVCKKMTSYTNPALAGKHPEFARMSLKPGIGALQCENMGKELVRAFENGHTALDVPREVRQAGRKMPLGRYVQGKLRQAVGWESSMPQDKKAQIAAERARVDPVVRNNKRESGYLSSVGRNKINLSRRKL